MISQVRQLSQIFFPKLQEIRQHLHRFPELSFQEVETGRYISALLSEWGISHQTGMAGTGVCAWIEGQEPNARHIALRADIDALPIQEINEVPYKSQHAGIMHACGHDAHSTCLLGAAYILHQLRDSWKGRIQLIFQPGEEKLPGGASMVLKEGWLDKPRPDFMLGQHVEPEMAVGKIGIRAGLFMASADEIYLCVKGKGGHGAKPHQCIDPVLIAANLIVSLQQLVSRRADPLMPSVLTFGKINSDGGATNVIPAAVYIQGTFRTFDETWRFEAHRLLRQMAEQLCAAMGGSCELEIAVGYPYVKNDDIITEKVRVGASEYLGAENVVEMSPRMGAEDFAYYSQAMPACFYRLGTKNPNGTGLHSNTFDIDEKALEVGAGLMAWLTVQ